MGLSSQLGVLTPGLPQVLSQAWRGQVHSAGPIRQDGALSCDTEPRGLSIFVGSLVWLGPAIIAVSKEQVSEDEALWCAVCPTDTSSLSSPNSQMGWIWLCSTAQTGRGRWVERGT